MAKIESEFKACSQYSDFNLSDSPKKKKKKPCDICASFGNKLLIMSCFKCRETKEHIYCAKVTFRRVPTMWLCEECRNSSSIVDIADKTADCQVGKAADSIDQTAPSSRTHQVMNTEAAPSSNSNQVVINKDSTEADPLPRSKQVEHVVMLDVVPHIHQYSTSEESSLEPSYPVSVHH